MSSQIEIYLNAPPYYLISPFWNLEYFLLKIKPTIAPHNRKMKFEGENKSGTSILATYTKGGLEGGENEVVFKISCAVYSSINMSNNFFLSIF